MCNVENEGAAEVLSRKLATEFAIMKLHDAIGSTVSAIDPANVSWLDVARLTEILQTLGALVSEDDTAAGRRLQQTGAQCVGIIYIADHDPYHYVAGPRGCC